MDATDRKGRRLRRHRHGQRDGHRRHPQPRGLSPLQKSLQGSLFGGGNPQYDIPQIYSLEQIDDGYRDMLEGRNIRGVIRFTDADRS
jgi:Zn-dependent alcohol dehydrogenase